MQTGGQDKHYEMPDPMFGFGGLQKLSELWPKIDLRMWICSLNRDKRVWTEGKEKDKTTWGPANSPSDISAEKWILCGWWVAEGMGKPTEETLVLLNNNITSPEHWSLRGFLWFESSFWQNRMLPCIVLVFLRRFQQNEGWQRTQLWIIRNYLYELLFILNSLLSKISVAHWLTL